ATAGATFDLTQAEQIPRHLGTADAALHPVPPGEVIVRQNDLGLEKTRKGDSPHGDRPWTTADVVALLPPGSRAVLRRVPDRSFHDPRWLSPIGLIGLDLRDPLAHGIYRLQDGRPPATTGEAVVSPWLVRHGVGIGATLSLSGWPTSYRVVGVAAAPGGLDRPIAVTLPEGLPAGDYEEWLADTPVPVTRAQVRRLNAEGVVVRSRAVIAEKYGRSRFSIFPVSAGPRRAADVAVLALLVTMLLLEVALLAGPAFAVGVRRRQRELALLAAQGASGRQLGLVVLADGLLLGGLATVAGVAAGLAAAWAVIPVVESVRGEGAGPYDVPVGQVAVVAVLGLLSAVLAAAMPARRAARLDTVRALTGLRGEPRPRRGRPLLGLALLIAGLAATFTFSRAGISGVLMAGGALAAMVGLVLLTPWVVQAAADRTARLPLALRFAGRDAARNRSRTAPAVAAVAAVTATFVTLLVGMSVSDAVSAHMYRPGEVPGALAIRGGDVEPQARRRLMEAVRRVLPEVPLVAAYRTTDVHVASDIDLCRSSAMCTGDGGAFPVFGGPDLLRYLLGRDDPAAVAALAAGRAVVFTPEMIRDGTVTLYQERRGGPVPLRSVPATAAVPRVPGLEAVMFSTGLAGELGVKPDLERLVVDPARHRVTPDEEQRLVRLLEDGETWISVTVERGYRSPYSMLLLAFGAAAALLALGGTFAATGLAAVDARPDVATMGAVGAPPRMRRLVTGAQAAFITGTGVVLGALCGLVIGAALVGRLIEQATLFRELGGWGAIPWSAIGYTAGLVLLLPLVAGLVAAAFVRTRITPARRMG
ncbi:FtsX-like permease family protein, partial [Sphaerisporangium rufum]|uniref:FtsX-like permease family protein n=1 Tax=Sphaerisporangium rufum TaxID=1381558 RepID=UPI001950F555